MRVTPTVGRDGSEPPEEEGSESDPVGLGLPLTPKDRKRPWVIGYLFHGPRAYGHVYAQFDTKPESHLLFLKLVKRLPFDRQKRLWHSWTVGGGDGG